MSRQNDIGVKRWINCHYWIDGTEHIIDPNPPYPIDQPTDYSIALKEIVKTHPQVKSADRAQVSVWQQGVFSPEINKLTPRDIRELLK